MLYDPYNTSYVVIGHKKSLNKFQKTIKTTFPKYDAIKLHQNEKTVYKKTGHMFEN